MIVMKAGELFREQMRRRRSPKSESDHVSTAIAWLKAAQDSGSDRGVAYGYLIGERWLRSYPETTGYIIPTMLNWGIATGEEDARNRAIEMAEWELSCQNEDGAISNLTEAAPTVFDTAQVLFGWIAAYRESDDERFVQAALRGAAWLSSRFDDKGVWRHASDSGGPGRVYNARSAWAVLELSKITGDAQLSDAVQPFLDWTLQNEVAPGWFDRNCLGDDRYPLLHTIAYTARGQLESGLLLDDSRLVEAAKRTAVRLMDKVQADGFMAGRFDRDWNPSSRWACLTGMAQTSIVWQRLARSGAGSGDSDSFDRCAMRVNEFLKRTHDLGSANPGLRGGVRGSFPVNGAYGKWKVLNWATKFFVDALMLQTHERYFVHPG